jgi:hypothetical protein
LCELQRELWVVISRPSAKQSLFLREALLVLLASFRSQNSLNCEMFAVKTLQTSKYLTQNM